MREENVEEGPREAAAAGCLDLRLYPRVAMASVCRDRSCWWTEAKPSLDVRGDAQAGWHEVTSRRQTGQGRKLGGMSTTAKVMGLGLWRRRRVGASGASPSSPWRQQLFYCSNSLLTGTGTWRSASMSDS
nr:hypothetical protein CFP56_00216 [Quercus suber]